MYGIYVKPGISASYVYILVLLCFLIITVSRSGIISLSYQDPTEYGTPNIDPEERDRKLSVKVNIPHP